MFSQVKDRKHIEQKFQSVALVMPQGWDSGCWWLKNFIVGICNGAPSTVRSIFELCIPLIMVQKKRYTKKFLPLKRQEKMHLKMSSAEVVCFKQLPNITDVLSVEANSVDPEQTAPIGAF